MPGESQAEPAHSPDPTVRTTEQMNLAIQNLEKLGQSFHDGDVDLLEEKIKGLQREFSTREAHRLELKADSERTLSTAREADQKAVAAALAAAEKARDQQTIASQLATDKAEKSLLEALSQQQATFTLAISNVVDSLTETKESIVRAEGAGAGMRLVLGALATAVLIAVALASALITRG